jgi:hypothetical protein
MAAAEALVPVAGRLAPDSLRRLITIRNWRPENERAAVDAIIREVRARNIVTAPGAPDQIVAAYASPEDGSGAQGVMFEVPAGKKRQFVSIMLKRGVTDAFVLDPMTKKETAGLLDNMADEGGLRPVETAYAHRMIAHNLALGAAAGHAAHHGLLQVAERAGAVWQPAAIDWAEEQADCLSAIGDMFLKGPMMSEINKTALFWIEFGGLPESWFAEGDFARSKFESVRKKKLAAQIDHVLAEILEPARLEWAGFFTRIGLFLRHSPGGRENVWQNFIAQSQLIRDGMALDEMPVMHIIARTTVSAFTGR